jgi:hypothetical protein
MPDHAGNVQFVGPEQEVPALLHEPPQAHRGPAQFPVQFHQVEHAVHQFPDGEGLLEQVRGAHAHGPDGEIQGGLAGHEDHRQAGLGGLDPVDDVEPVHPVHVDVGDHQVELGRIRILQQAQGPAPLGEGVDLHSEMGQGLSHHAQHVGIVIDEENVRWQVRHAAIRVLLNFTGARV